MSTANPIPYKITNPNGLDKTIQGLQTSLESISYLTSFGRARLFHQDGQRLPKVYTGNQEYFEVLLNDSISGHSFFYVTGPHDPVEAGSNQLSYIFEVPTALFVIVNLQKVDETKDFTFTQDIQNDIMNVITRDPNVVAIRSILDNNPNEIFAEFTVDPEKRHLLMYPKAALRINLLLRYEQICLN